MGVLQWAIELGCVNVFTGTSLLTQHLGALPTREGHLQVVYHIFGYLASTNDPRLFSMQQHQPYAIPNDPRFFDAMTPTLCDPSIFRDVDWSNLYVVIYKRNYCLTCQSH